MNLWSLGVDYRLASLEERVQLQLKPEQLNELTQDLNAYVWLSTCNRVEIYADSQKDVGEVKARWIQLAGLSNQKLLHSTNGREALQHLFRVAASLESMVVGESQIAGQVRRAYEKASEQSKVSSPLHRVFQTAFRVSKRVRSETEVGQFAVSVPSIGVKLAEKFFGNLTHRVIGVVGLGEIGRVAAEHFGSVGPKKLYLYNRTSKKAEVLAQELQAEDVRAEYTESLDGLYDRCDVIVCASSEKLMTQDLLQKLDQKSKTVFILDLGVPPCVESFSGDYVYIYRVDDLQKIAEENSQLRDQELRRAEKIIFDESEAFWAQRAQLESGEMIKRLSGKVSEIREQELHALRQRVNGISKEDWAQIEKMSERLSAKILQDPIVELKTRLSSEKERETWAQLFRNIFRI